MGLSNAAGCFLFPSLEAAATEIAVLLADREREIGGARNVIVYGHAQDPVLDRMAKTISSTGLEAKPKTDQELRDVGSWFAEIKSKALLFAFAENDRFIGRVHDVAPLRASLFGDGVRIPVLTLCFGSDDWRTTLPRPFEIRVYSFSGVALAVVGERLRLEPRFAPLSLDLIRPSQIEREIDAQETTVSVPPDLHQANLAKARGEIEAFEEALPLGFQPWWPKGSSRLLDRAIITTENFDGSWVCDQLRVDLLAHGLESDLVNRGLYALSGCVMNDERRQEWLRARGDDAWLIRGTIHVSIELLRALPFSKWKSLLSKLAPLPS